MSKVLDNKKAIVEEIKEKIENSKSMVMVDYRGLDVSAVNELRSKFRKEDVVYKVYKNTLMNFAFEELGYNDFLEHLSGPNAIAFSMDDPIAAARISYEFSKDNEALEIKAGYLGDEYLDHDGVIRIASIPSREVLIQRLLGSLQSSVTNFVYLIDAIKTKLEEEGPAEEAEAEETESSEEPEAEQTEETEETEAEEAEENDEE